MTNQLFAQTLPKKTANLVAHLQLEKPQFLADFYLSGGTALALQIGHRQSQDLDFFTNKKFNPKLLQKQLSHLGKLDDAQLAPNTLNTYLSQVKLQFLHYPYQLLKPTLNWQDIEVSSIEDIACTKLQTISMRGSKKDFVDLYFILKKFSLSQLFTMIEEKYTGINYNRLHILKSLSYFKDADQQPMPRMLKAANWKQIKKHIIDCVKDISLTHNNHANNCK
jgi:predicted nucleotidyltransferase component of viral defense system